MRSYYQHPKIASLTAEGAEIAEEEDIRSAISEISAVR
jgi:hypothetical protein